MPTPKKHRWICKELEEFLLTLHPAYDIRVEKMKYGEFLYFPIRDEDGNSWLDPYDPEITGIKIEYMKNGRPLNIHVEDGELDSADAPGVIKLVEEYMEMYPKPTWTDHLRELRAMQEGLRAAICKCVESDYVLHNELFDFPSFAISVNALLPYQKMRLCDFISYLGDNEIDVRVEFNLEHVEEDRIYATQECLALTEAAIAEEEQSEEDDWRNKYGL